MGEKTLNQVGNEAFHNYYNLHGNSAAFLKQGQDKVRRAKLYNAPMTENDQEFVEAVEKEYNERIEDATEFAKNNAEQLHDLANIEAHMAGVAIDVKQPIEIGQKVKVHTSKKQ